jgi:hypothetical protein
MAVIDPDTNAWMDTFLTKLQENEFGWSYTANVCSWPLSRGEGGVDVSQLPKEGEWDEQIHRRLNAERNAVWLSKVIHLVRNKGSYVIATRARLGFVITIYSQRCPNP